MAAISSTTPYSAVGQAAKWFSPIQPVAKGISESQNSRCRLAHSTPPDTCEAACSMWWWLFQ